MGYRRAEIFWESSAVVEANRPAMKALAVLAGKYGMEAVYNRLADGDFETIASWMSQCEGYESEQTVDQLAEELLREGAFNVEVSRLDRRYRIAPDGFGLRFHIIGDGITGLALSDREAITGHFKGMDGYDPGVPMMQNVYATLAEECREGRYKALCGILPDGGTPHSRMKAREEAKRGKVPEQPEDAPMGRTVVRETVVVREEPPELEKMLRQALADQLVKLNLDTVHETVKQRLIDDFGFEPERHEVKLAEKVNEVDGITHEKFDELLHYVANDIPCFCFGPAGSGKGVLGRHVAQALGLDYHFMTSVTDEFKINGYMDAYGTYHETPFYKAFKNGGLFFLDEMDASAPEVLVCLNMAISDRRYTFPHETLEAHPDFRVVAAGNTLGTGADASYTGRMQLDAATLNRFVVIEVDYDQRIDSMCAGGDASLVTFARRFREVVKDIGLPSVCSYRNITQIRVAKEALPLEDAMRSCLCKEMNQDDINIVAEKMALTGNPYFDAFKAVKSIVG